MPGQRLVERHGGASGLFEKGASADGARCAGAETRFGDAFLIENVLKLNICQDRFGTSIGKVETAASLQGKPTHLSTAVMESEGNGITWTAISPLSGKSA